MNIDPGQGKQIQEDYKEILERLLKALLNLFKRKSRVQVSVEKEQPKQQNVQASVEKETERTQQSNQVQVEVENQSSTAVVNTAKTAALLLNEHGVEQGQERVYQAQGYKITANEQGNTAIQSSQGQLLMQFKTGTESEIQVNNLSNRQLSEFTRVGEQIQQNGFAQEPAARLSQYQSLAPASDVTAAKEVRIIAAAISANNILEKLGTNNYENDNYQISRQGENITVKSKEGNLIAQSQNGQITGNLSANDLSGLDRLERAVSRPPVEELTSSKNLHLPHKEAVVYDRLMSTSGFTSEGAVIAAEQAVAPSEAGGIGLKEMAYNKEESHILSEPESNLEPSRQPVTAGAKKVADELEIE